MDDVVEEDEEDEDVAHDNDGRPQTVCSYITCVTSL